MSSRRWLPPLLWAAFILILTSIPGSHLPVPPFRYFDKVVHLAIYGVLGWLTARAWTDGSRVSAAALVALDLVSCFGAFDEWHQQFIPLRSMELLDWAADTTGAAIGVLLAMAGERQPGERVSDEHSLATTLRTQLGGALRSSHVGSRVKLGGWVQRQRAMGGIVFLDLRDRAGVVQVSFDPKFADAEAIRLAGSVGRESVVLIEGEVVARPENGRNAELATGEIEVKAVSMRVVGPAETPAIPVTLGKGETLPSEELRLRHRYLDLRRPELQANIVLRHRLMQVTRSHSQRARLPRDRDADSHQAHSRGRARLSGAESGAARGSSTRCRSRRSCTSSC